MSSSDLSLALEEVSLHFKKHFDGLLPEIYFYGAGCGSGENRDKMESSILNVFPGTSVSVESDMLGAARALCGKEAGIVGILGTGMNSCYYDGEKISEQRTSLGFILGDEGSGAYIGKQFLAAYLNDEIPPVLRNTFEQRFKLSNSEILKKTYQEQFPNRFLASFSKFIFQNINDSYCSDLVANAFRAFFDKHICKYPQWKEHTLSCTGSVAFWFSNILRRVGEEKGIQLGRVVETPIAALCLYYMDKSVNEE